MSNPRRRNRESFSMKENFPKTPKMSENQRSPEKQSQRNFSRELCIDWFMRYTTPSDPITLEIDPEGMEKFCEDIDLEPTHVYMLVLAYLMGASRMGFFTLCEWLSGLEKIECDSITKMKSKVMRGRLRGFLTDPIHFQAMFHYAYDFAKESEAKHLSISTATIMLEILMNHWPLLPDFLTFLNSSTHKQINKDQWRNILDFSREMKYDLSKYDVNAPYPVLFDDFVEWYGERDQ